MVAIGRVIKIVIWSLVAGVALAALGLTATDVWSWIAETAQGIGESLVALARSIGPYALAGAGIVVPVWLGLWFLRWWRRQRGHGRGRGKPGA